MIATSKGMENVYKLDERMERKSRLIRTSGRIVLMDTKDVQLLVVGKVSGNVYWMFTVMGEAVSVMSV